MKFSAGINAESRKRFLRMVRKIHRVSAVWLFLILIIVSLSGLLLGWKKHTGDALLPEVRQGSSTELSEWLPVDSLAILARTALHEHSNGRLSTEISRMDIRPSKGVVKFIFKRHYTGIQLDGKTGEVLHIGNRTSDLIENIHDGSILDRLLGTRNGLIKLLFTSISGLSLLMFTLTGVWLWYEPWRKRRMKQHG